VRGNAFGWQAAHGGARFGFGPSHTGRQPGQRLFRFRWREALGALKNFSILPPALLTLTPAGNLLALAFPRNIPAADRNILRLAYGWEFVARNAPSYQENELALEEAGTISWPLISAWTPAVYARDGSRPCASSRCGRCPECAYLRVHWDGRTCLGGGNVWLGHADPVQRLVCGHVTSRCLLQGRGRSFRPASFERAAFQSRRPLDFHFASVRASDQGESVSDAVRARGPFGTLDGCAVRGRCWDLFRRWRTRQ
jgi:hypothetical protein